MGYYYADRAVVGDGPYSIGISGGLTLREHFAISAYHGLTGATDTAHFNSGQPTTAYTSSYTSSLQIATFRGNSPMLPMVGVTNRVDTTDAASVELIQGDHVLISTAAPTIDCAAGSVNVSMTIGFEIGTTAAATNDAWAILG